MQLANLSLLVGGLLVGVPILLHLVMRQQPKRIEFPALRFVRARNVQNQRRLELKHWLLLLLRCAAILLFALALARPSVSSASVSSWVLVGLFAFGAATAGVVAAAAWVVGASRGLAIGMTLLAVALFVGVAIATPLALSAGGAGSLGDQEAPVSAVFVFDTSPRLLYQHENQTRLEKAQAIATWLTGQLPPESEVAVADRQTGAALFAADIGAARQAIQRLEVSPGGESLDRLVSQAIDLADSSEKKRKEIYVFTDLSQPAWRGAQQSDLKRKLADHPDYPLYLIDVGAVDVRNAAVADLQLSADSVSKNSDVLLQVEVAQDGPETSQTLELYLEQLNDALPIVEDGKTILPKATRRDRRNLQLADGQSQAVQFRLSDLEVGMHHGWVNLAAADGLAADDKRWFTFEVRQPWPLLVVESIPGASRDLINAIAPPAFQDSGRAPFEVDVITPESLERQKLDAYLGVVLIDPGAYSNNAWRNLDSYVRQGGGVAIFLGPSASLERMNGDEAQKLLPGKLTWQSRAGDRLWYLEPKQYQHQLLAPFREIGDSVPWRNFPVDRHWSFAELAPAADVVLPYSNGLPALIERRIGDGLVLTFTSSIASGQSPQWNTLFTGFDSWPFFVLSNQIARYLVRSGEERLNYYVGERASLTTAPQQAESTHLLFTPRGGDPQEVIPDRGLIVIPFTDQIGTYRLRPLGGGPSLGFSVNLPPFATQLSPLDPEELNQIFGADRYQVAREQSEIEREQGKARVGREFFSPLIVLVALMLAIEFALSQRFYRQEA
ncbi:MAG: BatA domain-containing protein [Blastopirellula sp. JB062]